VVNQKKGHCAKTDAILRWFIKHRPNAKYYVINDDDTWMDVPRLLKVCGCAGAMVGVRVGVGGSGRWERE
jgi:hypothetical protein